MTRRTGIPMAGVLSTGGDTENVLGSAVSSQDGTRKICMEGVISNVHSMYSRVNVR